MAENRHLPLTGCIALTTLHCDVFNVKYLENGERYDVGLKEGQTGDCQWAFD